MEKINFINYQQPAINDTNLNKMQDNVEDAIQEVQDVADDLDTSKLDKTSVKDTYSTSTTDTYSCNYVNENIQDVFSNNETKTNKVWNGKPVYRTVVTKNLENNSDLYIIHHISNMETFWINNGASSVFKTGESLPSSWYYSSSDWARTWMNGTQIRFRSPSNLSDRTLYAVVEYTKTTD